MENGIDMSGQVAMITGASRGLGRGFATAIAGAGASVALVARSEAGLNETAKAVRDAGGKAIVLAGDVASPGDADAAVAATEEELGPLDVLINNAGVAGPTGDDWEIDPTEWWNVFEVNVLGQFHFASAALRRMAPRGRGRVVNVSSAAAGFASPGYSAYCASKAALTLWTECLAGSALSRGVKVLAYHPGTVRTDMTEYSAARPDSQVPNLIVNGIRELFATGQDDSMDDAVATLLQVASGRFDDLPGRQIGIYDRPHDLASRRQEIIDDGLYAVRVRELEDLRA